MSNTAQVYVVGGADNAELLLAFGQMVVDFRSAITCGTGVQWLLKQMEDDGYSTNDSGIDTIEELTVSVTKYGPHLAVKFKFYDDNSESIQDGHYYLRIDPTTLQTTGDY